MSTTPQGSDWTLDDVVLQPGEEYVLCNNGFSQPALCDQLATIDHNGDDILTLTCSGNLVDSIGQANGTDVGDAWQGSDDESTKDQTLVRKCSVLEGDTDITDAYDPSLEWDGFPQDTFTSLGEYDCQ